MYDCFSCNCNYCCAEDFQALLKYIKKLVETKSKEEVLKYINEEIESYKH
jgi:hypothetical protein